MIRLKGRHGLVMSAVAHVGLLLGLFVAGAGTVRPVPPEPMTVEIVPASEAPPVEPPPAETHQEVPPPETDGIDGTPLESTSSGSEVSSDSDKGSASAERPMPKAAPPSLQQAQAQPNQQRSASPADPAPETQPQASEPLLPPTAQPEPEPKKAAEQPDIGDLFAMPLAIPGLKLGGGLDLPASTPAKLPHDDIAAFKARLSACSRLPSDIDADVKIALRISFKRDGTIAAPPQLLDATLSPDVAVLLAAATKALQTCQPFTELSADKYKKWKTIELVVTPLAMSGG
jgi:colicin import membrane protein